MRGPEVSLSSVGRLGEKAAGAFGRDTYGFAEEGVAGEMLKDECGDVRAGDAADLAAGFRRDDLNGVGGGAVGEAGGTDNGPVEIAGAEFGFHAFLVGDGTAKEERHESSIERRHVDDAVADAER